MGAKLFAAFGAGALVASGLFFFAGRQAKQPPPPPQIVTAEPVAASPKPAEAPATPEATAPVAAAAVAQQASATASQQAASEQPSAQQPASAQPTASKKSSTKTRVGKHKAKTFKTPSVAKLGAPAPEEVEAGISMPYVPVAPSTESEASSVPTQLPSAPPLTVTLPSGTLLQVRLGERLATDRNAAGDTFLAQLDAPLIVTADNGEKWVIAHKGARVLGKVVEVEQAGRVEGTARMTLELTQVTMADKQKAAIKTARFVLKGDTSRKSDVAKVGAGAAIGAIIGAIAGGGKGAAIGAASGGAAGGGVVLATRGKAAALEAETRLSFALSDAVTITERK